eukprot:1136861-Pelagomonas_calceolata.AAC.8
MQASREPSTASSLSATVELLKPRSIRSPIGRSHHTATYHASSRSILVFGGYVAHEVGWGGLQCFAVCKREVAQLNGSMEMVKVHAWIFVCTVTFHCAQGAKKCGGKLAVCIQGGLSRLQGSHQRVQFQICAGKSQPTCQQNCPLQRNNLESQWLVGSSNWPDFVKLVHSRAAVYFLQIYARQEPQSATNSLALGHYL